MPRLTPAERERAVGLLTAGEEPRAVAVALNVHLATIYRLQQRFTATGVTDDRPRTGRPRVTTQRQDRHIFRHHVRDRFQTANETGRNTLGNHQRPISGHTRLAGTPWGITRDLSAATRDWQEHPGESPETYQRPHETGRNTLGNHQRPISGQTRLAGTPWGITRDLSAATRDWQEHPGESPETYQRPHETGRNTLGNHQRPISGHTRLAGTPWGITRDLSAATRDWQEHPGESPETYQRPHETGRNTLGNHQRPISGHTRLAGTPWGITRDLSAATRDWQEHPGESPETYQRPHETGRNTLGKHQRPISGHTRLAGTPWGITRDLSAATRDW